jgi:hypothetical protein
MYNQNLNGMGSTFTDARDAFTASITGQVQSVINTAAQNVGAGAAAQAAKTPVQIGMDTAQLNKIIFYGGLAAVIIGALILMRKK